MPQCENTLVLNVFDRKMFLNAVEIYYSIYLEKYKMRVLWVIRLGCEAVWLAPDFCLTRRKREGKHGCTVQPLSLAAIMRKERGT